MLVVQFSSFIWLVLEYEVVDLDNNIECFIDGFVYSVVVVGVLVYIFLYFYVISAI